MKVWADMSETERNVLKAAHAAGHGIEVLSFAGDWKSMQFGPSWYPHDAYRIAPSAQADTPTLWRDMDGTEKGALLLAAHEGEEIEHFVPARAVWVLESPVWNGHCAYRVKPKAPKVETVTDQRQVWRDGLGDVHTCRTHPWDDLGKIANITHTYTIIDGRVTACDTIIHERDKP